MPIEKTVNLLVSKQVKQNYSRGTYTGLVLMAILIYLISSVDTYLGGIGRLPIDPALLTLILMAFASILSILACGRSFQINIVKVSSIWAPFALICFWNVAYGLHPGSNFNESGKYLFLPVFNLFVMFCSIVFASNPFVYRNYKTLLIVTFFILCISISLDTIYPGLFSISISQGAGFAENPNIAAFMVTMLTIAIVNWEKRETRDSFIWFISAVAIFLTLSRSGFIIFLVSFFIFFIKLFRYRKTKFVIIFSVFALIVGGGAFFQFDSIYQFLFENTIFRNQQALLKAKQISAILRGDFSNIDNGTSQRGYLFWTYWGLIREQPIFGYGVGHSALLLDGSHNIYLHQWFNNGFFGLILLLNWLVFGLVFFLRNNDWKGIMLVIFFLLSGLFSHNILEYRPFIIVFALMATISAIQSTRAQLLALSPIQLPALKTQSLVNLK